MSRARFLVEVLLDPFRIQPADLLKCLPQFACLVDINLACLLCISLPELLANLECLDPLDEDSALGGKISGTIEAKIGSKVDFVLVEEMCMRIEFQINWCTLPVDLERVGLVRKAGERWTIIGQRAEVFVLTCDSLA